MKGVVIHAGLLVMALVASLVTWAGDRPSVLERERVLVWTRDTTAVTAVEYRSDSLNVDITRRTIDGTEYFWGRETRRRGEGGTSTVRTFPAGSPARDIVNGLAEFRVVRDLGEVEPETVSRYGLDDAGSTLTVVFDGEPRVLRLGRTTPGDADRYGYDERSRRTYVIPSELIDPLETGEGALRERRVHYYPAGEVASVRVESSGRSRTMVRSGSDASGAAIWGPVDEPDRIDQGFRNFMERVDQLATEGFPDPDALGPMQPVLRADYFDGDGERMGWVELRRSVGVGTGPVDYFLTSERIPVPAVAIRSLAERVALDLGAIF